MSETKQVGKVKFDFDVLTGMPNRVEDAEAELKLNQTLSDKKAKELHDTRI